MYTRKGTPHLMKAMNRATIIDVLAKQGPISQTGICEVTGDRKSVV